MVLLLASSHSRGLLGSRNDVRLSSSSHTVKASWARPAWINAAAASKNNSGIQGPGGQGGGENWGGKRMQCTVLRRHELLPPIPLPGSSIMQGPSTACCPGSPLLWEPSQSGLPEWTERRAEEKSEKGTPALLQRKLQFSHQYREMWHTHLWL